MDGDEQDTIGVEEKNKFEQMFEADRIRSFRWSGLTAGVHENTIRDFLRNDLKFSYLKVPNWTKYIGNGQGKLCRDCSAMREVMGESIDLETRRFSDKSNFLIARGSE